MGGSDDKRRLDAESDNGDAEEAAIEKKIPYPKSVFFILSTEACERFSYYGMRTVLSLYLKTLFVKGNMKPKEAEDLATIFYHTFVFLSYFTSTIGAFLADSFLGKFRTIFYISIVYAIGQFTLSLGAVPDSAEGIVGMPQQAISFLGLFLIAFGTGGIKPCVVAFGADQFVLPQQRPEMSTFFGIFYASINFGSMISSIMTPYLRQVPCFGEESCFTLAFSVPAVLMVVAVFFFVLGRPGYKITIPEENVVANFFLCLWHGIVKKFTSDVKKDHFLDHGIDRFGAQFVQDVKAVLRVGVLFLLFPFYWALYDQQGSRWTFQATRMDGRIAGDVEILPDQMQVINAVLILLFIPIFDKGIYPLLAKFNLLKTPLQKIVAGGVVLGCAFLISAAVELKLQTTYPHPPALAEGGKATSRLAFHNGLGLDQDCDLKIDLHVKNIDKTLKATVAAGSTFVFKNDDDYDLLPFTIPKDEVYEATVTTKYDDAAKCPSILPVAASFTTILHPLDSKTIFFYENTDHNLAHLDSEITDGVEKSGSGFALLRFLSTVDVDYFYIGDKDYTGDADHQVTEISALKAHEEAEPHEKAITETDPTEVQSTKQVKICIKPKDKDGKRKLECVKDKDKKDQLFRFSYGGSFNIYMQRDNDGKLEMQVTEVTPPNSMHMLWLLPQYITLTAGEVLFSITSLAFSFTQAPDSMKAVVQALFLLTTAGGNLIDLIVVAVLKDVFSSQAYEFLLFAGLLFLNMFVLALLAMRYEYVDFTHREENGEADAGGKRSRGSTKRK